MHKKHKGINNRIVHAEVIVRMERIKDKSIDHNKAIITMKEFIVLAECKVANRIKRKGILEL